MQVNTAGISQNGAPLQTFNRVTYPHILYIKTNMAALIKVVAASSNRQEGTTIGG